DRPGLATGRGRHAAPTGVADDGGLFNQYAVGMAAAISAVFSRDGLPLAEAGGWRIGPRSAGDAAAIAAMAGVPGACPAEPGAGDLRRRVGALSLDARGVPGVAVRAEAGDRDFGIGAALGEAV